MAVEEWEEVVTSPDGNHRVAIFQRADGTFGFETEVYDQTEQCWLPDEPRGSSRPVIDSLERTLQEVVGRVPWASGLVESIKPPSKITVDHTHYLLSGETFYQLSWTTLPGLRGLSCSVFRATPTAVPDNERGVAVKCASDAERDALLVQLEAHFGPRRFVNTAAAFDAVKDYVALRTAKR